MESAVMTWHDILTTFGPAGGMLAAILIAAGVAWTRYVQPELIRRDAVRKTDNEARIAEVKLLTEAVSEAKRTTTQAAEMARAFENGAQTMHATAKILETLTNRILPEHQE